MSGSLGPVDLRFQMRAPDGSFPARRALSAQTGRGRFLAVVAADPTAGRDRSTYAASRPADQAVGVVSISAGLPALLGVARIVGQIDLMLVGPVSGQGDDRGS
jgi:hypothetical protein